MGWFWGRGARDALAPYQRQLSKIAEEERSVEARVRRVRAVQWRVQQFVGLAGPVLLGAEILFEKWRIRRADAGLTVQISALYRLGRATALWALAYWLVGVLGSALAGLLRRRMAKAAAKRNKVLKKCEERASFHDVLRVLAEHDPAHLRSLVEGAGLSLSAGQPASAPREETSRGSQAGGVKEGAAEAERGDTEAAAKLRGVEEELARARVACAALQRSNDALREEQSRLRRVVEGLGGDPTAEVPER
ncbi:unnamed protein product [Pedinophyceae sp. YPF-701]|nr:unnamed protein product [Pedinophyceae sp. YPF-701]